MNFTSFTLDFLLHASNVEFYNVSEVVLVG